jgi:hypothetical protein
MSRLELVLKAIQRNPRLFTASMINKKVRKAFIDRNNSLFYSINVYRKQIILLTFYDNRQDPRKFKIS